MTTPKRTIVRHWLGKKMSAASSEKKRAAMLGRRGDAKNPAWKGDKVGYMGLHNWVRRKLGTPSYCRGKNCDGTSKRYHWANVSGKYKRDLNDFIRLCISCHLKMDFNRKTKKHAEMRKKRSLRMIGNKYATKL